MKNVLFAICFLMTSVLMAQKPFQGTVNYKWDFSGEGVEMMQSMMPESLKIAFAKGGTRVTFNGGMMAMMLGDFVYNAKSKKSFMIKDTEETAYEITEEDEVAPASPNYEMEDEILTIQGYACQKYKMVSVTEGAETVSYIWVTKELMPYHSDKGSQIGLNGAGSEMGFPLKVMTIVEGMTMTMTVDNIDATVPDKKLFSVPKGYKVEPYTGM